MKVVTIEPDGWQVKIEECPPGFFMYKDQLCFKTEYKHAPEYTDIEVYCSTGETFMLRDILVQPVTYEIREDE